MFYRDILIVHLLSDVACFGEYLASGAREGHLSALYFRVRSQGLFHCLTKGCGIDLQLFKDKRQYIVIYLLYSLEDMFHLDILLTETLSELLRSLNGLLGFNGIIVEIHLFSIVNG